MSVETFWQSKFFVNRKTRAMSSRHFTRTWRISLIFSTRHKQIWTNERSKFFGQVVLFLIHNKCIGVLTCMVHVWMFVTPCIVPWMNKYVIEFFLQEIINALRDQYKQNMTSIEKIPAVVHALEVMSDGYIHGNSDFRRKTATYPSGFWVSFAGSSTVERIFHLLDSQKSCRRFKCNWAAW